MIEPVASSPLFVPRKFLSSRTNMIFLICCMWIPLFLIAWKSNEVDFRAFYVAALSSSNGLDPYADNRAHGEQFADPVNESDRSRWVYPPSALFFFTPFARLSYTPARLLFDALSLAALIWVLIALSSRFHIHGVWVVLAFTSLPVIACIERGQIDIFILFCLVLTYVGGRRFWAGIPLGLAISLKIFPIAILLWFVLQRRFREAAVASTCLVTVGVLSAWRFGLSSYQRCFQSLTETHLGTIYARPVDLVHLLGIPNIDWTWLALSQGFIGSYNNPLLLLGGAGILIAFFLVLAVAILLHNWRVAPEIGFFTMVLISQLINTRLWSMGMVMYLPIFLIAAARVRSTWVRIWLVVPLFLPSQVRIFSINPRFVIALIVIAYILKRGVDPDTPATGKIRKSGLTLPGRLGTSSVG